MKKLIILLLIGLIQSNVFAFSEKRIIKVGIDYHFPPFEFTDNQGKITGFNPELLYLMEKYSNLKFEIIAGEWTDIRQKFDKHEIDMLAGMFYSIEREKLYNFSLPHNHIYFSMFYRKEHAFSKDMELNDRRILVQSGDYMHEYFKENLPNVEIVPVSDAETMITLLSKDMSFDGAALAKMTAMYIMHTKHIDNIEFEVKPIDYKKYCFVTHKNNLTLLTALNEGLFAIHNNGEYKQLYDKWFNVYLKESKIKINALFWLILPVILLIFFILVKNQKLSRLIQLKNRMLDNLTAKEIKTQKALEDSEIKLNQIYTLMEEGVWEWDVKSHNINIISKNQFFKEFQNLSDGNKQKTGKIQLTFKTLIKMIYPADRKGFYDFIKRFLDSDKDRFEYELKIKNTKGEYIWLFIKAIVRVKDENNQKQIVSGTFSETSIRKRINDQAIQSQKMEAIGRLAGGISHDFNNLLTSVLGNLDIALINLNKDSEIAKRLYMIKDIVRKASELIGQLFLLGKKKEIQSQPVCVNESVKRMNSILTRLLGEDIQISIALDNNIPNIMSDKSQIDQILLNLALNARKSMPNGGKLVIETKLVKCDDLNIQMKNSGKKGYYAQICVSDSGKGYKSTELDHLFEPYYQQNDQESGLGLAIVYQIIKDNDGFINVYSEENSGSTFKIFLPVIEKQTQELVSPIQNDLCISANNEMIIVVEDNFDIRVLVEDILKIGNYRFQIMANATEAYQYFQNNPDLHFDLMICDIILPEMKGYQLIQKIQHVYSHPFITLYISGYPDEFIVKEHPISSVNFLSKPFTANDLLNKISKMIQRKNN
mgnify:CR=1 FL=1